MYHYSSFTDGGSERLKKLSKVSLLVVVEVGGTELSPLQAMRNPVFLDAQNSSEE
jgi:hypothetical protein